MTMDNAAVAGWKLSMSKDTSFSDQIRSQPNYWVNARSSLQTTAHAKLVKLGSGSDIYASILPELEQVEEEVILVTCFWAKSDTLNQLNAFLRVLSKQGQQRQRRIRARICFSSVSLWQKLLHTRSLSGRTYPESTWQKKLGLPSPHELRGLDLRIKSIFVLPISVMHSKFIILDRRRVFLPSCNISWENWFEGCIELTGPITNHFVAFWQSYWASPSDRTTSISAAQEESATTKALFLPSPHHPLSLFDSFQQSSPATPLNLFILSILQYASHSIYIQTPNLTSQVVLGEIVCTLKRGVNIRIVTSERLMILEQLVTARTTTARCAKWLADQHRKLLYQKPNNGNVESLISSIGKLELFYYQPRPYIQPVDPVQSHIKLMMADDELIVLGSGNLDRASWVTSQELGVAIIDTAFVQDFKRQLDEALLGRLKPFYPQH